MRRPAKIQLHRRRGFGEIMRPESDFKFIETRGGVSSMNMMALDFQTVFDRALATKVDRDPTTTARARLLIGALAQITAALFTHGYFSVFDRARICFFKSLMSSADRALSSSAD